MHSESVQAVAFSPNGKWLATGDLSGNAYVWNVETGERLQNFYLDFERISSVAFSPDEKYLLTGSWDFNAQLWPLDLPN